MLNLLSLILLISNALSLSKDKSVSLIFLIYNALSLSKDKFVSLIFLISNALSLSKDKFVSLILLISNALSLSKDKFVSFFSMVELLIVVTSVRLTYILSEIYKTMYAFTYILFNTGIPGFLFFLHLVACLFLVFIITNLSQVLFMMYILSLLAFVYLTLINTSLIDKYTKTYIALVIVTALLSLSGFIFYSCYILSFFYQVVIKLSEYLIKIKYNLRNRGSNNPPASGSNNPVNPQGSPGGGSDMNSGDSPKRKKKRVISQETREKNRIRERNRLSNLKKDTPAYEKYLADKRDKESKKLEKLKKNPQEYENFLGKKRKSQNTIYEKNKQENPENHQEFLVKKQKENCQSRQDWSMYEATFETNKHLFDYLRQLELETGKCHSRLVKYDDIVKDIKITRHVLAGFREWKIKNNF